jgi:hypothetical protein
VPLAFDPTCRPSWLRCTCVCPRRCVLRRVHTYMGARSACSCVLCASYVLKYTLTTHEPKVAQHQSENRTRTRSRRIVYWTRATTMFTQAFPCTWPSATTYESIATARRPSFTEPTRISSLREFSFQSVRSNISTSTASSARSNISAKSARVKARLHSLLRKSKSERSEKDIEDESDGETSLVTLQKTKRARRVSRNPEGENMFTWAALGFYACPGAGPLVGWV